MKVLIFKIGILMFIIAVFSSCESDDQSLSSDKLAEKEFIDEHTVPVEGKYRVFMKEDFYQIKSPTIDATIEERDLVYGEIDKEVTGKLKSHFKDYGIDWNQIESIYATVDVGFSGYLGSTIAEKMKSNPMVASVEQVMATKLPEEEEVEVLKEEEISNQRQGAGQFVNWGVRFVGSGDATKIKRRVFVLDTGIDLNHPDLNVVRYLSASMVGGDANDTDGHGTMVAGIIGAKNNSFGMKGVAAGAKLVAVKIKKKSTSLDGELLRGLDYVIRKGKRGDVVNISLGELFPFPYKKRLKEYTTRINTLTSMGIYVVTAGGYYPNWWPKGVYLTNDVLFPAKINGKRMYTITAMDQQKRSYISLHGKMNDYAAPGKDITSTSIASPEKGQSWCNKGCYQKVAGSTSYAAPHVAGILLLNNGVIHTRGYVTGDRDAPDPIAVVK